MTVTSDVADKQYQGGSKLGPTWQTAHYLYQSRGEISQVTNVRQITHKYPFEVIKSQAM